MSAPRLHGRRIGPIVPPLMEQDPLSTSSLHPTRGRWPTISGITILLPMAAVFAVVVLVHLPNQRAMDHAIQHANEDTIRAITVAPYAEAVQAIEEVVLSMSTIAAASQSSNIDMGTAQVLGIDNASGPQNATLSVPDEVMMRMQNASLHWDRWWIRWLRTMVAKKLLADRVSYSAEYVRQDGLCIGVLDSLSNVLYRGNCSSCSFVFAQWTSPRTADLPLQLSNWTRDFSEFDNRLRCSPVDEVACASSKYFHNPPQSYQDDRNAFFSAPEVSWSATRSCFGRYDSSFRSPVRGGGGAVGAFTLSLSSYHLAATAPPGMPSIFVDSRGGVFPVHKIPDAMRNLTRDSLFVWCINDALDVICLPTLGTVVAYWPVMYAAIVAAEVALTSALPAGAATTTTWTSDGQGGRIFVVATASSRPAGFYVRYAKEEDLTGRLTAALKRSRTMSVAISVALFVVALFMMAGTLLLLRTATYELRHACAHSIHQALTDRLRAMPLPRQQGHQPQSAIGEVIDAQSSTVGPVAMTTGRAVRDNPSPAAPAGPQGNASFTNRSASSRARVKLHRMQLQQQQGPVAASATLHSSPNPLNGITTEARQPGATAHCTSYRIAQSNVDGTRTASIMEVLASRLNVRLLAWGKAFKEPRLLLDATDSIARSIHAVIAYVPAGALVSLNVKEEAHQKDRRLGATSNTSWCATLDCFEGFCSCCRSRRDQDVQLPSDVQSGCRVEMSPFSHSSVRGARGELSAMVPSLQRQTCRPSPHHSPVDLANRVAVGSGNTQHLQGNGDTHEGRSTACTNGDIQLPPALAAQPPESIASAFVIFDIGWCALDEPVVAKEYMRLMDMVLSMFGRFGGFVDVVEASTVVASFNLHLPCDDFCDRAVQCATSLLRAMDEKLKIWSLDEESISLRTFATEFIIAVDAGEATLDNFSFMRTSTQSERMTRVRTVVVESKTMVRLRALVPFLRDQQLACTATLSVMRYGDVSVPLVAADIVTWAHDETLVLYNAEGSDGVDVATLQAESNLIEEALGHMGRCEYDAALRVLGQYEWGDCSPVDRMQSIAHAQLALSRDAQVPYKAEYDALRSWRLQ